jgi:hypothetical protein
MASRGFRVSPTISVASAGYAAEAGKNIISVALLSGVFKVADLEVAQNAGLYLVWAQVIDGFIEWVKAQT